MKLLITRPLDESKQLAIKLEKWGLEIVIEPLINIQPTGEKYTPIYTTTPVIVTSKNALTHLANPQDYINNPIYCVGSATAAKLQQNDFNIAAWYQNIEQLKANNKFTNAIYLSADYVTDTLDNYISKRVVIYKSKAINNISNQALQADAALFYSTRTAQIFANLAANYNLGHMQAISISNKVADELKNLPLKANLVAVQPTHNAVIDLLKQII